MIDPKYADLPGIAYDQPDIYETEDFPDVTSFQNYIDEDGDSVEKIHVSVVDAFHKFKDKHIRHEDENFSDIIFTQTNIDSNLRNEKNSKNNEVESPHSKYSRIKKDIAEFINYINTIKENLKENEESKSLIDMVHQIESAGKELDALNIEQLLSGNGSTFLINREEIHFKELASQIEVFKCKANQENFSTTRDAEIPIQESLKQGSLKYQMIYHPDKAMVQNVARLSHLEKRIGFMENLIGTSNNNFLKYTQILKSQGITQTIEKLMANVCLLNSIQLDMLENKITSLIHKMDNLVQKKNMISQDSKYEKIICELYESVKQSDNYSKVLPQIVDRMLSLSRLHQKAAEFAGQLKELEDSENIIDAALKNNRAILEEVQKNFSHNLEIVSKDIISLKEQLKKLEN